MKLIKVVPKTQAMYYRLKDNRIGVIYPNTGYIRVSPSWINDPDWQEWYNIWKMQEYLKEYEQKNCVEQAA